MLLHSIYVTVRLDIESDRDLTVEELEDIASEATSDLDYSNGNVFIGNSQFCGINE